MSELDHRRFIGGLSRVLNEQTWDELGDYVADDATWEYPQSGEKFVGLQNIRGQFENYPDRGTGNSELKEVIGGTTYAMTPLFTLVTVDGSGDRGTSIIRVRYPDESVWWAVNLYEVRDGKIVRSRSYFAPEFDPPDWRAPYREPRSEAGS